MTTTLILGPVTWPLSVKANVCAEGVTLLVQSDDWREAVAITGTGDEVRELLRKATEAVEALGCGLGWGCTDLNCPEHGAALRANVTVVSDRWAGPEDAA